MTLTGALLLDDSTRGEDAFKTFQDQPTVSPETADLYNNDQRDSSFYRQLLLM